MRLFSSLMGIKQKARALPQEPVPFKEILPLKLQPAVSGKGGKMSTVCCLYEIKEVASFQKCYSTYMEDKKRKSDREMKGILTPGERNLTAKQLNILLKRHPQL